MKTFAVFLCFLLSVLGADDARSADLPLPGGPVPPNNYYPVSAPINWGGVYIGLNGGYGFAQSNWSDTLGSTGNFKANGGLSGYTWSHVLFYATAGGATGNPRLSDSNGVTQNPTAALGWTAGGGIEYLFTDSISAKIEYLYVDLGKISCPAGALCSIDNVNISDGTVSFTESLVRVGLNYKFSW